MALHKTTDYQYYSLISVKTSPLTLWARQSHIFRILACRKTAIIIKLKYSSFVPDSVYYYISLYNPMDTAGRCRSFIVGSFFFCGIPNCVYILALILSRVPSWSSLILFAYVINTTMGFVFNCSLLFQVPGINLLLQ
jgi:hypothetical protein